MKDFIVKKFYMIRHGESVANVENWAAGAVDTPLTERGRAQAEAARLVFEAIAEKPVRIVHSHLSRAKETAQIVNKQLKLPMQENTQIGEQSFGVWAGQPWDDVARRLDANEAPPEGESNDVFMRRAVAGLQSVFEEEGLALIVSHGHVFDALCAAYGYERLHSENCRLYVFDPLGAVGEFPWRIERFDLGDEGVIRTPHFLKKGSMHAYF